MAQLNGHNRPPPSAQTICESFSVWCRCRQRGPCRGTVLSKSDSNICWLFQLSHFANRERFQGFLSNHKMEFQFIIRFHRAAHSCTSRIFLIVFDCTFHNWNCCCCFSSSVSYRRIHSSIDGMLGYQHLPFSFTGSICSGHVGRLC